MWTWRPKITKIRRVCVPRWTPCASNRIPFVGCCFCNWWKLYANFEICKFSLRSLPPTCSPLHPASGWLLASRGPLLEKMHLHYTLFPHCCWGSQSSKSWGVDAPKTKQEKPPSPSSTFATSSILVASGGSPANDGIFLFNWQYIFIAIWLCYSQLIIFVLFYIYIFFHFHLVIYLRSFSKKV